MTKSKIEIHKKCECCGNEFIAYKITTKYCSNQCAKRAYKDSMRRQYVNDFYDSTAQTESRHYDELPFLSVSQAAALLGISRKTMYRYLSDNIIKAVQFKGKTIIRRKDIEAVFDSAPGYAETSST